MVLLKQHTLNNFVRHPSILEFKTLINSVGMLIKQAVFCNTAFQIKTKYSWVGFMTT